ncbi:MAG: PAS domain-containing sensor histidine kinase, partial [Dehalococcoidales bacterium]|nr:PAS domain-containing sensor histidine kinase [Dehalococcoidales bacterium]
EKELSEIEDLHNQLQNKDELIKDLNARFRLLAETVPVGIRILNEQSEVIYCNPALEKLTGIKASDAIGKKCWESFPSVSCHTDQCSFRRIQMGETELHEEKERVLPDGTVRIYRENSFPFKDINGKNIGMIETYQDLSKEKLLTDTISNLEKANSFRTDNSESEEIESLISIIDGTGEAIAVLKQHDNDFIPIFVNNSFTSITGLSTADAQKGLFSSIVSKEARDDILQKLKVALYQNTMMGAVNTSLTTPTIFEIPVKLRMRKIRFANTDCILVRFHEISSPNKAEDIDNDEKRSYNLLFQNSPIPTCELDFSERKKIIDDLRSQGISDIPSYIIHHPDIYRRILSAQNIVLYNNAVLKLHDVKTAREIKFYSTSDQPIRKMMTDPQHQMENIERMVYIADGITPPPVRTEVVTPKGQVKTIVSYYFVSPDDTERKHVIWAAYDITDTVRAEKKIAEYLQKQEEVIAERTQKLSQSLEELNLKNAQQKKFVQHLIHDLKTPLMPMLGASEMLMQSTDSPTLKRIANNINRGTIHLKNSINDLVDIMRGENGVLKLDTRPDDINKIIKDSAEFFSFEINQNGQNLVLDLDPTPIIEIDHGRIKQVVANILENAIRFTPTGGTIKLSSRYSDEMIIVTVEDDGIGFKVEDPNLLFEPYYSTEFGTGTISGLGLGLPLAKMIINLHGGTIHARKIIPHGALFEFTLPFKENKGE